MTLLKVSQSRAPVVLRCVALRCVEATSIWSLKTSIGPRWGISMLSRCRPIVYVADDRALGSTLLVFDPS
jgi:hypothetical protein